MENIFLDTSIFESENFFEGRRIKQFFELGEKGHIRLILPKIVIDEVENRIKKRVREAVNKHKKLIRKDKDVQILKNIGSINERLREISYDDSSNELIEKFKELTVKSKAVILEYKELNIGIVFKKYFDGEHPFHKESKKSEFPDAFALNLVEDWCNTTNSKCNVLSTDNDIIEYKSKKLILHSDYQKYLGDLLIKVNKQKIVQERLAKIEKLYQENIENYKGQIENWVEEQFQLSNLNDYLFDRSVHSADINYITVDFEDYEVINIEDNKIEIEANVEIEYDVDIVIDDENTSYYDDEDKTWIYPSATESNISDTPSIPVILKYEIPQAGEQFAELTIFRINNDNELDLDL